MFVFRIVSWVLKVRQTSAHGDSSLQKIPSSICRKIDNALDHPEHRDRVDRALPAVAMRVRDTAQRDAAETRSAAGGSITTVYRRRSSS